MKIGTLVISFPVFQNFDFCVSTVAKKTGWNGSFQHSAKKLLNLWFDSFRKIRNFGMSCNQNVDWNRSFQRIFESTVSWKLGVLRFFFLFFKISDFCLSTVPKILTETEVFSIQQTITFKIYFLKKIEDDNKMFSLKIDFWTRYLLYSDVTLIL